MTTNIKEKENQVSTLPMYTMPARRLSKFMPTTNRTVRDLMGEVGRERIEDAINSLKEQACYLKKFEDEKLGSVKDKAYAHDGITLKWQYKGAGYGAYVSWWDREGQRWREIDEEELGVFLARYLRQDDVEAYLLSRKARRELIQFIDYLEKFERAFGVII